MGKYFLSSLIPFLHLLCVSFLENNFDEAYYDIDILLEVFESLSLPMLLFALVCDELGQVFSPDVDRHDLLWETVHDELNQD